MKTFLILFVALTMTAFIAEGKGPNKGGGGTGTSYDPKKYCSLKSFSKEKGAENKYHISMLYTGPYPSAVQGSMYVISNNSGSQGCQVAFPNQPCNCSSQLKGNVAEINCVTGDLDKLPWNATSVQVHYQVGGDGQFCEALQFVNAEGVPTGIGATTEDLKAQQVSALAAQIKANTILVYHAISDIYQLISPIPTTQKATEVEVEYLSKTLGWKTAAGLTNTTNVCNSFSSSAANCLVPITQSEILPVELAKLRLSSANTTGISSSGQPIALNESIDADILKGALSKPYHGSYSLNNILFRTVGCSAPTPVTRKPLWQQTVFKQATKVFSTVDKAVLKNSQGIPIIGQLNIFENGTYFLSIVIPEKSTVTQSGIFDFEKKNVIFYINTGELNRGFLAGYSYDTTFNGSQLELTLSDPAAQSLACTADGIQSITLKKIQ